jgi:CubicO group peptidase (beta-lactamase class C family)
MNNNIKIKILIIAAILISFGCVANGNAEKSGSLASEATSDLVQHGFWKNPNLNYISTGWPNDSENLRIDHVPNLENASIDTAPTDRNDGLMMGELGIDGGDKAMIVELAQEVAEGQHGKFDSLLIAHKGKLVFESYYLWGRLNLAHPQASATKTYTGLALGRAIQMGYLTMADLDKPLVSFLKDLDPTKFVAGAEKITLHHALTMSSGIRINEKKREEMNKYPDRLKGQGYVQVLLEHSAPITEESQVFKYGFGPDLVMQVIDAIVPGTAKDFIKNEFFGKMDITTYEWLPGGDGLPAAGWKMSISSRTMLKLGTLAMNKGNWNGEQLVPEAFITKAINRIVRNSDDENFSDDGKITNTGYGYFWWQADMKVGSKNYFSTSARGGGGMYIILIDELDLIVVMSGFHRGDDQNLQMTAERILPAFIKDELPDLKGPYIGQKPPGLIPEVFAPGIVSKEHRDWTGRFTPDMKEYYFTRNIKKSRKSTKIVFKSENNRWHETELGPQMAGAISPDGKTMHSGNQYRERTDNGWSESQSLGSRFEDMGIMVLTVSSQGTYVFDDYKTDKLRYSRLINGNREAPKAFGKEINSGKWTAHPFIAPDESYIIWDSERESGYGDSDLYISFRQRDGSWGAGINLGDKINTGVNDTGGVVSPDGKYFFFNRKISAEDSDTYWVDAQIIETLRPKQ